MPRDPFKAPPGQKKSRSDPQGKAVGWWYGKRKVYTGAKKTTKSPLRTIVRNPKGIPNRTVK